MNMNFENFEIKTEKEYSQFMDYFKDLIEEIQFTINTFKDLSNIKWEHITYEDISNTQRGFGFIYDYSKVLNDFITSVLYKFSLKLSEKEIEKCLKMFGIQLDSINYLDNKYTTEIKTILEKWIKGKEENEKKNEIIDLEKEPKLLKRNLIYKLIDEINNKHNININKYTKGNLITFLEGIIDYYINTKEEEEDYLQTNIIECFDIFYKNQLSNIKGEIREMLLNEMKKIISYYQ